MPTMHISPKGSRPRARSGASVAVYGTNWCAATQMVRRYLDRLGVPYRYKNMDQDRDAANRVAWWTGGDFSHPTLHIGGDVLVEPRRREIENSLRRNGLL